MPTTASIANEVRLLAGYFKLKAVFVAVQKSHANLAFGTELLDSLRKQLGKDVTVLSPSFNVPWVDLNILGAAGEFCRIYYCDVLFLELCARAVVDVILDECQMRTPHRSTIRGCGRADVLLGNCGSTFSAYVHRQRTHTEKGQTNLSRSFFSGQVQSQLAAKRYSPVNPRAVGRDEVQNVECKVSLFSVDHLI